MRLDASCIVKQGYLVKSPPLDKIKNRVMARWHMRWFVLYDTKPRCDVDPAVEREVELLYYKNHECHERGELPIGRIDILDSKIAKLNPGIHGYPFAIKVSVTSRQYYLCATQFYVFNEWLQKLKSYQDVGLTEESTDGPSNENCESVQRNNTTAAMSEESWKRKKYSLDCVCKKELQIPESTSHDSTSSTPGYPFKAASVFFDPYYLSPTPHIHGIQSTSGNRNANVYIINDSDDERDFDISDISTDSSPPDVFRDSQDKRKLSTTVSLLPASLLSKQIKNYEDEKYNDPSEESDEGIVRTSSESSTTSREPTPSSGNHTLTTLRQNMINNDLEPISIGFVGPRFRDVVPYQKEDANNNNDVRENGDARPSSLDSIEVAELNASSLFDETTIDELFPRLNTLCEGDVLSQRASLSSRESGEFKKITIYKDEFPE